MLTRTNFRTQVLARDKGRCVVCGRQAADAHHIIERRLWPDGGYRLNNGASLCSECHLQAEQTLLSCEQLRIAASIASIALPPQLEKEDRYDKWGNVYLPDGRRAKGPLFYDESVQKVLEPVLGEFSCLAKHPRTPHLPWSPGAMRDDLRMGDADFAELARHEVVVTEKLDGENTSLYRDYFHARSLSGREHSSRSWAKGKWAEIRQDIPDGWRVVCENMYAVHSIHYSALPSYLIGLAVFSERNICLSWDDTLTWLELLDIPHAPVLWRGQQPDCPHERLFSGTSQYGGEQEGYVVRAAQAIAYANWSKQVGKYVRPGHVADTQHWFSKAIVKNDLN